MARRLGYLWHLRLRMAERGMFNTPDLAAALRERGVVLSDSQVWRLVTGTPERLNLRALVAPCDILDCTPNDLIEPVEQRVERPSRERRAVDADVVPKPARVKRRERDR
jgi:DNA-binding Xre family transcriptional regulator